jgi:hypothetical protein
MRVRPTPAAWPLLLSIAAFAAGLRGGFVEDDPHAILNHPAVNGSMPVFRAFALTFWGHPLDEPPLSYRPLCTLSFRLDYALAGPAPTWFHVSSLAYYLLLIHLVHRFARRYYGERESSVVACLFATAPIHVENVSCLVGRADTLALVFSMIALECTLWRKPTVAALAATTLCYWAAILCKESAVVLPAVAGALMWFTDAPSSTRRHLAVMAAAGAAYAALRLWLIPGTLQSVPLDYMLQGAAWWRRLLFAIGLAGRYARLLVAPVDLCTGRDYAMVHLPGPRLDAAALAGLAMAALLAWRTWSGWRARRPPWWLCATLAWSMFSSLPVPLPEPMADRFMLSPSLFIALAVGAPLARWAGRSRGRATLAALIVVAQSLGCALHARTWRTNVTLFQHGVTACPDSVTNHLRHAQMLAAAGEHAEAVWHFAVAAEGRRHFPGEWHHPAQDAELSLPASERLLRMHELLGVDLPEPDWRRRFARFLRSEGHAAEAELVWTTSTAR